MINADAQVSVQLRSLVRSLLGLKLQARWSCRVQNLLRLTKVLLLSQANYAGVVAQSAAMPLIKATNDTSSHVQDIFDAVDVRWQLSSGG